MPDPERLRRAAALRGQSEPSGGDEARLRRTPLEELQHLAVHASSESVRVQATRVLLERADMAREREEARKAAEARQGEVEGHDALAEYVRDLSGENLDRELDAMLSHYVETALAKSDEHTGYPLLVAAFRRAVERHVAALSDVGRIEAEVERRAQEKAESMYRTRSFSVVTEPPEAATEATDDEDEDGEPGFTAPREPKPEPPPVHPFMRGEEEPPPNPLRRNGRRRRPYGGGPHRLV